MSHPIPVGRRAALHDPAVWVPLKGIVSRMVEQFGLEAEAAGGLIAAGLSAGTVGHRVANGQSWIVSPRAADLVRLSGVSYEDHIDWNGGRLCPPGGRPELLEVFWPDVERAFAADRRDPATGAGVNKDPVKNNNKGGRPPKYNWPGLQAALAVKLSEDGSPADGEQAALEKWAVEQFSVEAQPAQSQIREHVSKAIAAHKALIG